MPDKPKLAMYWASSCGGCEISIANLHERILDVDAAFDFMFCPCLLDTKKKDIEAMPDGGIAVTFFNGAIRNEENEEMARLLRKKSKLLIAYGSCASEGCIPALANLHSKDAAFKAIYLDNPTIDNPSGVMPQTNTDVPEGPLRIPAFYDRVKTLRQTVDVDYSIPGCPPESKTAWAVIEHVVQGKPLPPKGSVLGAGKSAVCDECKRKKEDKKIKKFFRTYEIVPDREKCLLEQGIICMGIATRDGCGALCPEVNMPCSGCYGPPDGVLDQGAKMVSALGSALDIGDAKGISEEELAKRIDSAIDAVSDYAGLFYKFSLGGSIFGGKLK